MEHFCMTIWQI